MTSYIPIRFPDGFLYPIKAGGYTGATEPTMKGKYTEAEIKKGSDAVKKEALKTAVADVKTAYQLFVTANLGKMLAAFDVEKRERTDPTIKKRLGKTYYIWKVTSKKVNVLHAEPPYGAPRIPLYVKDITALGKSGAVRVWLEGKPFAMIDDEIIEDMVKKGSEMVGILFGKPAKKASFTLAREPRKETTTVCPTSKRYSKKVRGECYERRVSGRPPSVRGASGEIDVSKQG